MLRMDHNPLVILSKAQASALLSTPASYCPRGRHVSRRNGRLRR
jgi:hypothetical protein